jgi:uncharacterized protein YndB with AHSA1/START domain
VRFSDSIDIDADPAAVWAVLTAVEDWPQWTASMVRVQRLESGPFGLGSTVRIKQPRLREMVWRVTAYDPGRSFTWTARGGGVETVAGHEVTARAGGGSSVTLTLDQRGPLAGPVGVLGGRLIRRYLRMEAEGLRRRASGF